MASSITLKELKSFHSIDQKIYVCLAFRLGMDPLMIIKVIALWIWIEACGYPNMVVKLLETVDDKVVNMVANEAMLCINYLENGTQIGKATLEEILLPISTSLLGRRLSLEFFHKKKDKALRAINTLINGNLSRALMDIGQVIFHFIEREIGGYSSNANDSGWVFDSPDCFFHSTDPSNFHMRMNRNVGMSIGSSYINIRMNPNVDMYVDGSHLNQRKNTKEQIIRHFIQQPPSVGGVNVGRAVHMFVGPSNFNMSASHSHLSRDVDPSNVIMFSSPSYMNLTAHPWIPYNGVPQQERNMFVTFSRGYPVTIGELHSFFLGAYGICVDLIHMEEVSQTQQPLFALVVFQDALMIPLILEGKQKAKFVINGKKVWMRKFILRHGRNRQ